MEFLQFMEPWMIPIVIMVCVTLIVIVSAATKIITTSIENKHKNADLTANKEFIGALREFKEDIEYRIEKIEKKASADKNPSVKKSGERSRENQNKIELDFNEDSSVNKESKQTSKLKNMLNQ